MRKFWSIATAPHEGDPEIALREYMTKVISLLMGVMAFGFVFLFLFGWIFAYLPADSLLIMVFSTLLFVGGWFLAYRGFWRLAGFLPPISVFLIGVYGNIIGGMGAPAMVLYALSIVLTAVLQGTRVQWAVVCMSIAALSAIELLRNLGIVMHTRSSEGMFANRILIISVAYAALAALVRFLIGQYRQALARSRASARELEKLASRLIDTNRELECEIDGRIRIEDDLRISEDKYRTLVNNIPDIVYSLDGTGAVQSVNQESCRMFGYDEGDIIGKPFTSIIHPDDRGMVIESFLTAIQEQRFYTSGLQFRIIDAKNGVSWVELHSHMRFGSDGNFSGEEGVLRDITRRWQAEEQIRASLREKEVLLKEIHHRVKNNFQIIISILNLQTKNVSDEGLLRQFTDLTNRIRAMALVHEKLYLSDDIAQINFASYIQTISDELYQSYRMGPNSPELRIEAEEIFLGIDQAIPCGLIVNELLTNALKYAFPHRSSGCRIVLSASRSGDHEIDVRISDNGVGLPEGMPDGGLSTLGLELVNILVKQLRGTISVQRRGGTVWSITFPSGPAP